ncbi:MAG: head-tail connector protein [Coriobacteriales bacterium]|jgi:uncharacterized phage protein (predicted DNA packaging)|nr:head-tail connector protein [Coriobacteriales bacterium]
MLLDDVKLALRITTDDFDSEVADLIIAAKRDIAQSGVSHNVLDIDGDTPDIPLDNLIKLAIIHYVKATWGMDNPDSERYWKVYYQLEKDLALSQRYTRSDDAVG